MEVRVDRAILPAGFAANWMHPKYQGLSMDKDQIMCAKKFLKDNLDNAGKEELKLFIKNRQKGEPDYYAENCVDDPLTYWSLTGFLYPTLSKLMMQLFLIPASTTSIEGLFSQWTYVHNLWRNRLSDTTSFVLIDLYNLSKHIQGGCGLIK